MPDMYNPGQLMFPFAREPSAVQVEQTRKSLGAINKTIRDIVRIKSPSASKIAPKFNSLVRAFQRSGLPQDVAVRTAANTVGFHSATHYRSTVVGKWPKVAQRRLRIVSKLANQVVEGAGDVKIPSDILKRMPVGGPGVMFRGGKVPPSGKGLWGMPRAASPFALPGGRAAAAANLPVKAAPAGLPVAVTRRFPFTPRLPYTGPTALRSLRPPIPPEPVPGLFSRLAGKAGSKIASVPRWARGAGAVALPIIAEMLINNILAEPHKRWMEEKAGEAQELEMLGMTPSAVARKAMLPVREAELEGATKLLFEQILQGAQRGQSPTSVPGETIIGQGY